MVKQLHLIKGKNNTNVAFHTASSSILKINDFVFEIIKMFQNKNSIEKISHEKGIDIKILEQFLKHLKNSIVHKENIKKSDKTKKNWTYYITCCK